MLAGDDLDINFMSSSKSSKTSCSGGDAIIVEAGIVEPIIPEPVIPVCDNFLEARLAGAALTLGRASIQYGRQQWASTVSFQKMSCRDWQSICGQVIGVTFPEG